MDSRPSAWAGLRWPVKAIIIAIPLILLIWAASSMGWIPGMKADESKDVAKSDISRDAVNTHMDAAELPVLNVNDLEFSTQVDKLPELRLMNWVWFGNAGIFSANGGLNTMKGSLMEQYKVNLKMITNNSVADMKREQLAFIKAYADGNKNPDNGVHFVTIMGDGAPMYVSAMNQQITEAVGAEYNLKIIGNVGFSMGEDCLMGPEKWKTDPQTMKGSVISAVIGDGDWALVVRYAADNGIKINPDPESYDPNAVNFIPAPDDDFMMAAQEVITNRQVELKEVDANGKFTGKMVKKAIEGAATWFPGDIQMAKNTGTVKIISTSQYPNQMATVVVGCGKWMKENQATVVSFLSAALTASNQVKQYPAWFDYATKLAPKVFCASESDCSETSDDWKKYAVPNGASMRNQNSDETKVGGTQMANLADNQKYYGLKGGNNYYKSVYDYFSKVITDLNPFGFMNDVKKLTSYEDAMDLSFLKQVNVEAGTTTKVDYSKNEGEVFATRNWQIQFESGSDKLLPEGVRQLEELFQALNIAENARVNIVGHTDSDGDEDKNIALSLKRAKAVKQWLMNKSNNTFPSERFSVDGLGEGKPIADNNSNNGKAQNRRVEISLVK